MTNHQDCSSSPVRSYQYRQLTDCPLFEPGPLEIWYLQPSARETLNLDLPIPLDRLPTRHTLATSHILLGAIQPSDSLDANYSHLQAEIWSPHGEARALIETLGLDHTSMSVGDGFLLDCTFHLVARTGYRSIPLLPDDPLFGSPISIYTRAQAIEDGTLVEVPSLLAREAGIRLPVTLTRALWEAFVTVPEGVIAQDETGRLWDILWIFRWAASKSPDTDVLLFTVHVRNDNVKPRPRRIKAIIGPGDDGAPVLTLMLPEES